MTHCAWLVVGFVLATAGCASHRYTVTEPVQNRLGSFASVEVGGFTSNLAGDKAQALAQTLPQHLIEALAKAKTAAGAPLFGDVSLPTDARHSLVITGRLLSLEEGSRAKRYWLGFGAGKAYTTVECSFVDETTGKAVATATFDGELSGGLFGGSSEESVDGVLKAIIDYINDNY